MGKSDATALSCPLANLPWQPRKSGLGHLKQSSSPEMYPQEDSKYVPSVVMGLSCT